MTTDFYLAVEVLALVKPFSRHSGLLGDQARRPFQPPIWLFFTPVHIALDMIASSDVQSSRGIRKRATRPRKQIVVDKLPRTQTPMRNWEPEEDATLLDFIGENGSRWKAIAKLLPGRTEAMCRNRYQRIQAPSRGTVECVNKCTACGQLKRGHTCPVRAGSKIVSRGGALGRPFAFDVLVRPESTPPDAIDDHVEHPTITCNGNSEVQATQADSEAQEVDVCGGPPMATGRDEADTTHETVQSESSCREPAGLTDPATSDTAPMERMPIELVPPPLAPTKSLLRLLTPENHCIDLATAFFADPPMASKQQSAGFLFPIEGAERPPSPPPLLPPMLDDNASFGMSLVV